MPIRINFLAEEQAADDLRRQDPVKHAILGGVALVVLTLTVSAYCQLKVNGASSALAEQEANYAKLEEKEKKVIENLGKTRKLEYNLTALLQLSTNRFMWTPVLNALQSVEVDHVHITGLSWQQRYAVVPPFVPKKDSKEKPRAGTSTESIVLLVEGYDDGPRAATSYIKFKEALANVQYFKDNLNKEKGWLFKGIPEEAEKGSNTVVKFKLEGFYTEKVRSNE